MPSAAASTPRAPKKNGDFLARLGRSAGARVAFDPAAALTRNARERALLLERAAAASKPATEAG